MMSKYIEHKESGLVSIFSVIFFMIFMSVIVIGFIKIIGDETRQTADNDLTASALISAQSGAEEAKRMLLYCANTTLNPAERARCDAGLNQTGCKTAIQQFGPVAALNLNVTPGDEGIITENANYEQRYTCLTIATQTPTVEDIEVPLGTSKLIPLRVVGGFDEIVFGWHDNAADKDGTPALGAAPVNSSQPEWNNLNRPGMMRLEFIPYPKSGAIDLAAMEANTRTVFVTPRAAGGAATSVNLAAVDPRQGDPNLRVAADVRPSNCDNARQYVCVMSVLLSGMPAPTATHDYMLRVTSYYRGAHISLRPENANVAVNFDNVQPLIDVTGRANDVFRRIQMRVAYEGDFFMPEAALSSANGICKQMIVTDQNATSTDNCP